MSSCSLGVNALSSRFNSIQAAARHLTTKPCSRFLPTAAFPSRCLSYWPTSSQQRQRHPQLQLQRGGHGQTAVAGPVLLRNGRPVLPQWVGIRTIIGGHRVIAHYVDLPPNYKDEEGLPFARRDLTEKQVFAIFGSLISTVAANKLLRILHGRRVAGTLDDPTVRVNTMVFSAEQQRIALAYLRKYVPVDEIANAGLRAEDELAALEGHDASEGGQAASEPGYASKLPLYKDKETSKNGSVYGTSTIDEIRAYTKAKNEEQLKRLEEEKKKREAEEQYGKAGPLEVAGQQKTRQLSAKMQEYMVRGQSDLKEPPKMKMWQRLLPSAAFVVAVVGLCAAYAHFYRPTRRADRLFPDIPPAAATVGMLILANLVGWALWKVPPIWGFLNRYFIIVAATPRPATMVSALFSHQSFVHLLQNMVILWFLGVRYHDDVGRGAFLATYFGSGAVAALATLSWAAVRSRFDIASLGASGAIYGIGAAYLWLHRFDYMRIFNLPPPPSEGIQGLSILALAAGLNIAALFTPAHRVIDITSHMVGMGTGILAAHQIEKGKKVKRPAGGDIEAAEAVTAKTPVSSK
ncbi:hypothetical protein C7999DRAFT_28633 [Corynascus novoguineensis]|uniref:Peptidase S54 rhomboid domain-containing protein n=1 Tax=Corynascus novoguineensis TaxID=1126955 RepID=A0AAN7HTW6_9PEZI|nr:hypothetical protein C7999DRAFT_28633 [Corynascus novoguineensis]